jgi:hypothetical protein
VTVANVLELVARMRSGALSRNRHFDAFANADGAALRARRVWRYLRSLERDLAVVGPRVGSGVELQVETSGDGGRRITLSIPEVRLRRTAVVGAEEYELLREHPVARAILDAAESAPRS